MQDYIKKIDRNINDYHNFCIELEDISVLIEVLYKSVSIVCNSYNYKDIYIIVNYFIEKGYDITTIDFYFLNDKGLAEIDYTYIHKIRKIIKASKQSTMMEFIYDYSTASYDDFFAMIESLKWYRSLINGYDLSPIEKLTYAYDICKTIHYSRSGKSFYDIDHDNTLHLFIKTGNIVCLGYNRLLREMLSGIEGIKFSEFRTMCHSDENVEYHSRGIVRVDDEDYNIHGIYILDVTWDSVHEEYEKVYKEEYDSLSAYRHFLVPIHKYGKFFKGDTYPRIFLSKNNVLKEKYLTKKKLDKITSSNKSDTRLVNKQLISDEIVKIINKNMTMKELYKYLNCDRLDMNTLIIIIGRVRLCQGYDIDDINGTLIFGIDSNNKDLGYVIDIEKNTENLDEKNLILSIIK